MNFSIRLLQEQEIERANHIFRFAFGTFIGLPDPLQFADDAAYIRHRYLIEPTAAFVAELDGQIIGSNLATNWGSFGFFGPLSVHPDFWNQGVAKKLIAAVCNRFEEWGIRQAGLFTFPNSAKHHALYQKFGFCPQFLTAIMAKSASASTLGLGDTIFLVDESRLVGLAICHYGAGTEAGSNNCYVKFAAVRPEINAVDRFSQLVNLCENMTLAVGMSNLLAGVNTSRHEAYRLLIARGFRTQTTGIAMQRPNTLGYNRSDIFVLDDWR